MGLLNHASVTSLVASPRPYTERESTSPKPDVPQTESKFGRRPNKISRGGPDSSDGPAPLPIFIRSHLKVKSSLDNKLFSISMVSETRAELGLRRTMETRAHQMSAQGSRLGYPAGAVVHLDEQ